MSIWLENCCQGPTSCQLLLTRLAAGPLAHLCTPVYIGIASKTAVMFHSALCLQDWTQNMAQLVLNQNDCRFLPFSLSAVRLRHYIRSITVSTFCERTGCSGNKLQVSLKMNLRPLYTSLLHMATRGRQRTRCSRKPFCPGFVFHPQVPSISPAFILLLTFSFYGSKFQYRTAWLALEQVKQFFFCLLSVTPQKMPSPLENESLFYLLQARAFLVGTFSVRSLADLTQHFLQLPFFWFKIQSGEKALIGRIIKVDEQVHQYQLIPVSSIQLLQIEG